MGEIEGAGGADEEREVSHWPEMTDGGNNDATVDRVFRRSDAVVAPTRERLTAIAEAVEVAPKIGRRSIGVELSELRWLLAQAGRLVEAERHLAHNVSAFCFKTKEAVVLADGSLTGRGCGECAECRANLFLAPPSQPSTLTSSPPVEELK